MSTTDNDRIPPERLYKYRGAPPHSDDPQLEWHRKPIVESVLHFAAPSSLNDVFDCSPCWVCDASSTDIENYVAIAAPNRTQDLDEDERAAAIRRASERAASAEFWKSSWEKQVNSFGVYSMSEVPDHPLMWAHYGGNHRGYCVEFSLLDPDVIKDGHIELLPLQVHYSAERPKTHTKTWLHDMAHKTSNKKLFDLVCHKDASWSYEKEWRLIAKQHSVSFPPHFLSGIIFGARCSEEDEAMLREWASQREQPLQFRRVLSDPSGYTLSVKDLA